MEGAEQRRPSAVLIPVYRQGGDIHIVLVERGAGGPHGGQVRPLHFATWPQPLPTECVTLDRDDLLLWGLTLRILDAVVPRIVAGEFQV